MGPDGSVRWGWPSSKPGVEVQEAWAHHVSAGVSAEENTFFEEKGNC